MGALNSFGLWGALGLLGVAVPIIIHLLYRKNRKQTDWAAMELLRRALVVRSGQIKLEDFIVLLLRCLAMLLIAFALLRPVLKSGASAWLGEKRVGMVVAIDASLSMGHGEHSRFEKALAKAEQVLGTAREGDPVTVVLLSERPDVLVRAADFEPTRVRSLLETKAKPSPHKLGLEGGLALLAELAGELKAGAREVYVITDAQESDWGTLSGKARDTLETLSDDAGLFVLPVEADGEENLGLASLRYTSGPLQSSGVARFEAEVRNPGRRTADGGNIEFSVGGKLVSRRAVGQIGAGESRVIPFFAQFDTPGDLSLEARLSKDDLAADNHRSAVVHVRDTVRVLCVDSDTVAKRGGSYYTVRALRLKSAESDSAMEVNQVAASDLNQEQLDDYDVIVFTDVPDPAPDTVDRLRRFTERGGGLIVFAGGKVDPDRYTERFGSGDDCLLPATFGPAVSAAEDGAGWSLAAPDSDHPLAALVKRLPENLVNSARISKVLEPTPTPGARTILNIAENDTPLLLARDYGAGSVLLFTSSADRSWNELAVHPLYAMLLQQAATTLTGRPDARLVECGTTAELPLPAGAERGRYELVKPDGETESVFPTGSSDGLSLEIAANQPGVYQLNSPGGQAVAALAANFDPSESDVRTVAPGALGSTLGDLDLKVVEPKDSPAGAIKSARRGSELSNLLLMLALLCFIAQSVLAKLFTNRMSRGETDIAASLQMGQVAAARRS